MADKIEILKRLYSQFNAREMEAVLSSLDENVVWANGMEGGYVYGRGGVREYWTRQWAIVDPHVEPIGFTVAPDGAIEVGVHQVARDLAGNILLDRMVGHIFRIEDGLVQRFDIR
jgi:hypothetical protein